MIVKTLRDYIYQVQEQLESSDVYFGHGTDNALDEAAYLVSHCAGLPPDFTDNDLEYELSLQQVKCINELLEQRIEQHKPASYLTREAWFAGYRFYVDERVLIPRSPFSELIYDHFYPWLEERDIHQVLDLCTGSGCIGIAIAHELPGARVDLADISEQALEVARINISQHKLDDRVTAYQSDLFSDIPGTQYDLIVSNPPYVDAEDMSSLPAEYHHEPQLGLSAGEDGLDLVLPMLRDAPNYLTEKGVLVVEVGNSEAALADILPDMPFTWLEFEYGGHGVFMLTAQQLRQQHGAVLEVLKSRNAAVK